MMLTTSQLKRVFAGFIAAGLWLSGCGEAARINTGFCPNVQQINKQALPSRIEGEGGRKETANPGENETVCTAAFKGTLQAIYRNSRQVAILLDNGKIVTVKVGKGGDDMMRLKPGNLVSFNLREAVEIVRDAFFHPETGEIVERFPPGSMAERELSNPYYNRPPSGHHAFNHSEVIEVPARVVSVDLNSRSIRLVTYDNTHFTVSVSDKRVDIAGLEPNEPVVARFREIDDLHVIDSP